MGGGGAGTVIGTVIGTISVIVTITIYSVSLMPDVRFQ